MRLVWGKWRCQVAGEVSSTSNHTNDLHGFHCKIQSRCNLYWRTITWLFTKEQDVLTASSLRRRIKSLFTFLVELTYKSQKRGPTESKVPKVDVMCGWSDFFWRWQCVKKSDKTPATYYNTHSKIKVNKHYRSSKTTENAETFKNFSFATFNVKIL